MTVPSMQTKELFPDHISRGTAAVLGSAVDAVVKVATPEVISVAVKYYDESYELLRECTLIERQEAVEEHLRDYLSANMEEKIAS